MRRRDIAPLNPLFRLRESQINTLVKTPAHRSPNRKNRVLRAPATSALDKASEVLCGRRAIRIGGERCALLTMGCPETASVVLSQVQFSRNCQGHCAATDPQFRKYILKMEFHRWLGKLERAGDFLVA